MTFLFALRISLRPAPAAATVCAVVLMALPLPRPAGAQGQQTSYAARADSLFQAGRVFAAETLYYYAARRSPRDPKARIALGRYLSARGALRIGAVLLEEARYFGGNVKEIGAYLAPTYAMLHDYRALIGLPGTPLPYAERARAEWLRDHLPTATGPDTVVVPWVPHDSGALGEIAVVMGTDTVRARIDPRESGLVLDTSWLRRPAVRVFASTYDRDYRNAMGVVRSAAIGALSMGSIPARFDATGGARNARVGLVWLAAFSPTFDARAATVTLRRDGRMTTQPAGERVPTLTYLSSGIWLIRRDGVWPVGGDGARTVLAGHRWTVNSHAGEIIVAPN
ncbi:MAG: hypothetical protein NVS1B4_06720 [Gemmatimonadaceae bacterium]